MPHLRPIFLRHVTTFALLFPGLVASPGVLTAQDGHDGSATEAGGSSASYQEHVADAVHEKNEIAVMFGATRRLKFEDDETGATFGLEYMRRIHDRAAAFFSVEWADGDVERDWIAVLNVGVQPLNGWAEPLTFYVGAGLEVAEIDETEPEHHEESAGKSETETETEVDALMRLGVGWPIHAGRFSIIPNVNFDIVGEDWSVVAGVALGYRF